MAALDTQKLKETIRQGHNIFQADASMNLSNATVPLDQTIGPSETLKVAQKTIKPIDNLDKSNVFDSSIISSPNVSPDKFNPYQDSPERSKTQK